MTAKWKKNQPKWKRLLTFKEFKHLRDDAKVTSLESFKETRRVQAEHGHQCDQCYFIEMRLKEAGVLK